MAPNVLEASKAAVAASQERRTAAAQETAVALRKQLEEAQVELASLRTENQRLRQKVVDALPDQLLVKTTNSAVVVAEPAGRIIRSNQAADEMFGAVEGRSLFGLIIDHLKSAEPTQTPDSFIGQLPRKPLGLELVERLQQMLSGQSPEMTISERLVVLSPTRGPVDALVSICIERDDNDQAWFFVTLTDVEALNKDHLTGLWTRSVLSRVLEREIGRRNRKAETGQPHEPLSILMVDIDLFKRINDGFGHPVGDAVIRRVAQLIARNVRKDDVVTRYGGEEFAGVLVSADLQGALVIAERIRAAIESATIRCMPAGRPAETVNTTISVGVSTYMPGDTPEAIIERADQALYAAKHAGRNRVGYLDAEAVPKR